MDAIKLSVKMQIFTERKIAKNREESKIKLCVIYHSIYSLQ